MGHYLSKQEIEILIDFELGMRNSVRIELKKLNIEKFRVGGECFHKTQALMKNLQSYHLKELYKYFSKKELKFNQFNY